MGYEQRRGLCHVVQSISAYRQAVNVRKERPYGPELYPKVEGLLKLYHAAETAHEIKTELKEEIILRTFFLFPHIVKKRYSIPAAWFDDAMMNMVCNLLIAIELYDPERGKSFTNYLIAYCRNAISKTFKGLNVISPAVARREMVDNLYADDAEPLFGEKAASAGSGAREEEEGAADEERWAHGGALPEAGRAVPLDENRMYESETDASRLSGVDEDIHRAQLIEWLVEGLSTEAGVVTDEEREVLIQHFGLFGHPRNRYKEIAAGRKSRGKGGSSSRISQIKATALCKLAAWFRKNGIEG